MSMNGFRNCGEEIERRLLLSVPVIRSGECPVTVPCGGDRRHALAQDDEMLFSIPAWRLEDLLSGLRHFDEIGLGYTSFAPEMGTEYPLFRH
jgi:hypothetical protein